MAKTATIPAASPRENTIPALLKRNAKQLSGKPANREKEFGIWQTWTWSEVEAQTRQMALGLVALKLNTGDHVAVIGRNRPRLYWSMVAVQMAGGVPVPLYQDTVADEMAYVLAHSEARFVVAGDQEQVDKVLEIQDRLENIERILYLDERGLRKYDHSRMYSLDRLQEIGRDGGADVSKELERRTQAINGGSACVMLYTSGTTGNPKGVVLSHNNIIFAARGSCEIDRISSDDTVLAYLPMAWIGDFIFSVGQSYWAGFCVNCPESSETVAANLREIGPTYYFAPPRIFETMLTGIRIRMEDAGWVKRRMFDYFMAHAKGMEAARNAGDNATAIDRLLYWLGNLLVYGPLRNTLGFTRIRVGYTGGEAIGQEIFDFYRSIGINLKQLYGQTEASVFITIQMDGGVRAETVGIPFPGVELRIDDSGEVFYRSPGTFVEYFRNPEATASTKDPDGWVSTGDAGFLESDTGQLRIIDRAKDVGRMQDGSLFAPKFVENKLKFFSNILEAVVFGAGRETCMALINIDLAAVGNWAERSGIAYASYQELAAHPKVREMIAGHVRETNLGLACDEMLSGCQISRFVILHKELDADDGELTRTRKVRRRIIEDKYRTLVEALYGGENEVFIESEVTYEDGRKGVISATLTISDVEVVEPTRSRAA